MENPNAGRILVADDMRKWHYIATKNLEYWKFPKPLHAFSKKAAERIYHSESPYLIITDINFDPRYPGDPINNKGNLDGLILTRQIKKDDPSKIVIIMSSIEQGVKEIALEAGADYFIQKQNFIKEFDTIVKQWK